MNQTEKALAKVIQTILDTLQPERLKLNSLKSIGHEGYICKIVSTKTDFCLWFDTGRPLKSSDLYIIPAYSPFRTHAVMAHAVSGNDDVINSIAITHVHAPEGSTTTKSQQNTLMGAKHPLYAKGNKINIQINSRLLEPEGQNELKSIVQALLGLNRTFVAVKGGFIAPLENPFDIARRAGISKVRGSEGHCVWTYNTLMQERVIRNAYIPPWFDAKLWVEAYQQYGGFIT